MPYFSDAPNAFLLKGSMNPLAHSFLASVPQSASEFEGGGPQILVVQDPAVDPVLGEFLRSCRGVAAAQNPDREKKLVAALKKKLSAYRHGPVARRIYPQKFAQYQKLLAQKVVRLGDLIETGFFTEESHLAFAVLSYLAFSQAGVDASVRLGTMTKRGSDASAPALGRWFHNYAWMETQNQVASFSAGVQPIKYIGTEGTREVAVNSWISGLYHLSRGLLDVYVSLPAPAPQITYQSYSPWGISAAEHAQGTLRVRSLQENQFERYLEAFQL